MDSSFSLQNWLLSYALKSLTEEVWSHPANTTVPTAISIFFLFCFHSRSVQHSLHYSMTHSFYACLASHVVVCVCIIDKSKSRPEYKTTAVIFQMYLQGKNTCCIRVNTVFVTGQGEHIESGTFPERLVLCTDCLERARKHQQRWRRSRRSHMSLLKREMVRN